jgi:hypothetical protein
MHLWKLLPLVALAATACATTTAPTEAPETAAASSQPVKPLATRVAYSKDPYPSTYKPLPAEDVFIRNATVFDGLGGMIERGAVLIQGGKISAIGSEAAMTLPAGVKTIAFIPPENHAFNDPSALRDAKPTHIARSYAEIHRIIINHA